MPNKKLRKGKWGMTPPKKVSPQRKAAGKKSKDDPATVLTKKKGQKKPKKGVY